MKKIFLLCFVFIITSFSIQGKDIKVLAIGNSFSEDGVEYYLYELAAENGDNLIIGNAYRGGQGLESHWTVASNNEAAFEYRKIVNGVRTNTPNKTLLDCLLDEEWDYITFQQVSQDSGIYSTYEPYLTYLLRYVKNNVSNSDVQYGMHRTWAYAADSNHSGFANYQRNQMRMFEAIVKAVNRVFGDHNDIDFIVPAGTAIQNGRTSFIGDNFCRDGYHLSEGLGRYTAACTWLEIITGKSAVDNPYSPSSVSELEVLVAQNAAHYAVLYPDVVTTLDNVGYEGDNKVEPQSSIKINCGNSTSESGWNNISRSNKLVYGLKDFDGNETEIILSMDDDFSGANTEGVQDTNTVLEMPSSVSSTSIWGYAQGTWGGDALQKTGGFLFSHLNKDLVYDLYIFASRKSVSDNRETKFEVIGKNTDITYLDAANNADNLAIVENIVPTEDGTIRLTASPGANNTNGNKFYYINAMQLVAKEAPVGTRQINNGDNVKIYPTIVTESLKVLTEEPAVVIISDSLGRLIGKYQSDGNLTIETNYPSGIYFITVIVNAVSAYTEKIIIQK